MGCTWREGLSSKLLYPDKSLGLTVSDNAQTYGLGWIPGKEKGYLHDTNLSDHKRLSEVGIEEGKSNWIGKEEMLKGTRLERTARLPQAWHDVKTQILKMLEEIRPPTKYQWKLSSTQKGMERKKEHAESMLRQSVSFRSNKGGEVEQSRQIHKAIQRNTEI